MGLIFSASSYARAVLTTTANFLLGRMGNKTRAYENRNVVTEQYNEYSAAVTSEILFCLTKLVVPMDLAQIICGYVIESKEQHMIAVFTNWPFSIPFSIAEFEFECYLYITCDSIGFDLSLSEQVKNEPGKQNWICTATGYRTLDVISRNFELTYLEELVLRWTQYLFESSSELSHLLLERGISNKYETMIKNCSREVAIKILDTYVQNAQNYLLLGSSAKQKRAPVHYPIRTFQLSVARFEDPEFPVPPGFSAWI